MMATKRAQSEFVVHIRIRLTLKTRAAGGSRLLKKSASYAL